MLAVWNAKSTFLRNSILLAASYYFYAYWDYRFCGLLAVSTVVDFFVAKKIDGANARSTKRNWLFTESCGQPGDAWLLQVLQLLHRVGRENPGTNGVEHRNPSDHFAGGDFVLHVSNTELHNRCLSRSNQTDRFTFETLAYLSHSFLNSSPAQLSVLRSCFRNWRGDRTGRTGGSTPVFKRRCCGLVKKVLIADRLGEMVDVVFAGPELYSGWTVWLAVIAYTGQIYYDFSGYSDIAIGIAKMLGYRFPANFRHPYLSRSLSEFWRRWQMTLSRWLRDYVYISLGGNRSGKRRTYVNLILTMALGGIWHGAAWTFAFWGLWHGAALAREHARGRWGFDGLRLGEHPLTRRDWLGLFSLPVVFGLW